jgi:undecaprenyl diphosphate synthase
MDGNGRWALARNRVRVEGHAAGVRSVRRVVESAPKAGIRTLTLYAFSGDNWQRPAREVATLMRLFRRALSSETPECVEKGVRVSVIGRRDRLDPALRSAIAAAEQATAGGTVLHLRLAIDYSSRETILRAAARVREGDQPSREEFARLLGTAAHASGAPDVDLLIRTGGEQRLSDFMLWEAAYAELYFTPRMWPDFDEGDLAQAVREFHSRERRFGRLPESAAAAG